MSFKANLNVFENSYLSPDVLCSEEPYSHDDLYNHLIDAGMEEYEIEQKLVAGISIEEIYETHVSDGFDPIND